MNTQTSLSTSIMSSTVRGMEIRKVEIFRDGRRQAASHDLSLGNTFLSDCPIPSLDEINQDPEFKIFESALEIFEAAWAAATTG